MPEYSAGARLRFVVGKFYQRAVKEIQGHGWVSVQYLRNAELKVLSGQRSGRRYNVPGTGRVKYYKRTHRATITYRKYTASAPGEAPAVRTSVFRTSWQMAVKNQPDGVLLRLNTSENRKEYPGYLERGTGKMAARPYVGPIQEMAEPQIRRVYQNMRL